MKEKLKLLGSLASVFFRIGLFTFGGGYAMIPLIQREVVEGKRWMKEEEILDMLAIAESTPGPLAINSATFVGFRMAGILGSAIATLSIAMPSFIIITVISIFLTQFKNNEWFGYVFKGIRSGVLVLMLNAVIRFGKACPRKIWAYALLAAAFALAAFTGIDIAFILLGAGLTGVAMTLITEADKKC